uniref:Uncharacterized protein n=1 Tax=Glossina pallidipes TaxID=7398 RepID=A0A1B0AAK8_GLOPL
MYANKQFFPLSSLMHGLDVMTIFDQSLGRKHFKNVVTKNPELVHTITCPNLSRGEVKKTLGIHRQKVIIYEVRTGKIQVQGHNNTGVLLFSLL